MVRALSDAEVLLELAEEAGDEASAQEAEGQVATIRKQLDELEFKRMLSGELDGGVDVAVLRPLLVEMRRLGGDADVVDERGNDRVVPELADFHEPNLHAKQPAACWKVNIHLDRIAACLSTAPPP